MIIIIITILRKYFQEKQYHVRIMISSTTYIETYAQLYSLES